MSKNQKADHRRSLYRASYPTSTMFTCKVIKMICAAVTLVLVTILLIGAIDGIKTESFYGYFEYTYATDSFLELAHTVSILIWIPVVVSVIVGIVYLVNLGKLGSYDNDLSTALGLWVGMIVMSLAAAFISNATLDFLISVVNLILSIAFYYFLCNGFSSICREDFPEISSRWKFLFKLFIVVLLGSCVGAIVVAMKSEDGYSVGLAVWMIITYGLAFVQEILELVALKKTADALGSLWNS